MRLPSTLAYLSATLHKIKSSLWARSKPWQHSIITESQFLKILMPITTAVGCNIMSWFAMLQSFSTYTYLDWRRNSPVYSLYRPTLLRTLRSLYSIPYSGSYTHPPGFACQPLLGDCSLYAILESSDTAVQLFPSFVNTGLWCNILHTAAKQRSSSYTLAPLTVCI